MADAWSMLDFDPELGVMTYSHPGSDATPAEISASVVPKYSNNPGEFASGHTTVDDSWSILWNRGQNAKIGWGFPKDTNKGGQGPKALGAEFAGTQQFSRCVAKKAYTKVCLNSLDLHNSKEIEELSKHFQDSGYKLRSLFAKSATMCAEKPE